MDRRESLHEQITSGPVSTGTFFQSNSPRVAEALGRSGIDFVVLDRQHASPDDETVENVLRAADLTDLPVLARLATADSNRVNTVLDAGASGVMIPGVEDAATVESVADRARYGRDRSLAFGTRGGKYGDRDGDEYVDWVNETMPVVPQIETVAGVENVDDIVALDTVDAIFVGPGDLAFSMSVPFGGEEVQAAVDDVLQTAGAADCGAGIFVSSFDEVERYADTATYVTVNSDLAVLARRFDAHAGTDDD